MYAVLETTSVTEDVLSTTMCVVERTLNARPLTPVSSDVAYPICCENSFDKLKPMQISYGTDFVKNICQLKTLKEGDLVWLTEESDKRDYHILARFKDNIGGSDGVIRSAIV